MIHGLLDRFIGAVIKRGTLEVRHADGSTARYGSAHPDFPDVAIRFTDRKAVRDILADPRLGAAEAFMDGRLVLERGGIMELIQLLRSNSPWDRGGGLRAPSAIKRLKNALGFALESVNNRVRSQRNVAHHYDIGNDFYRLMLDAEHMQYSCAYWGEGCTTLADAQEAKLAHIAAKLAIEDKMTVLDIGCGWGGMAIYLARHYDVQVKGVTLSHEQLAFAKQRAREADVSNRVDFELIDYRDLAKQTAKFDRIVSVGMFEHVGRPQFEQFFKACTHLLASHGVMLLHTIGRFGGPGTTDSFTRKYIFPGGYIPALSETLAASEKFRLIHNDIETLRLHYAKTLRAWYAACEANHDAIVAMYDDRFYRMWTFYLSGATAAFEWGGMGNYQILFSRNRNTLPITRGYMAKEETKLLS